MNWQAHQQQTLRASSGQTHKCIKTKTFSQASSENRSWHPIKYVPCGLGQGKMRECVAMNWLRTKRKRHQRWAPIDAWHAVKTLRSVASLKLPIGSNQQLQSLPEWINVLCFHYIIYNDDSYACFASSPLSPVALFQMWSDLPCEDTSSETWRPPSSRSPEWVCWSEVWILHHTNTKWHHAA